MNDGRCIATATSDNVAQRCRHPAKYPASNPKYCGRHNKSKTRNEYVRSPSPPRKHIKY